MIERLKKCGYRITPQRQEIFDCFKSGGSHYSAEEVHRKVRGSFPNISLDTVYRNLNTLKNWAYWRCLILTTAVAATSWPGKTDTTIT